MSPGLGISDWQGDILLLSWKTTSIMRKVLCPLGYQLPYPGPKECHMPSKDPTACSGEDEVGELRKRILDVRRRGRYRVHLGFREGPFALENKYMCLLFSSSFLKQLA
jgi:hypothetical protein